MAKKSTFTAIPISPTAGTAYTEPASAHTDETAGGKQQRRRGRQGPGGRKVTQMQRAVLLVILFAFPVSVHTQSTDLQLNYSNCKSGEDKCDPSLLTPEQKAQVEAAKLQQNYSNCLLLGYDCDPSLLTPEETALVEAAKLERNYLKCQSEGRCDPSFLTPEQKAQVEAVKLERNYFNCRWGNSSCNPSFLTPEQKAQIDAAKLERNYLNCRSGNSCDNSLLTPEQKAQINAAKLEQNYANCRSRYCCDPSLLTPEQVTSLSASGVRIIASPCVSAPSIYGRSGRRRSGRGQRTRSGTGSGDAFPAITNQAYNQECSSCHFAYQPGLLPARSWQALMKSTDNHFGENIALESNIRTDIIDYLVANSADTATGNAWSRMITDSLNADQTPERITEVPFIRSRHRRIGPACDSCHTTAAQGEYGEEFVRSRR